jgi:uncharacterized protein GlcG (DUF336 family)
MTAVDAELRGHFRAIEALGASRSLAADDLQSFYIDAERVRESQPDWQNVVLSLPSGQQVVNLALPFGTSLATTPDMESTREVVATLEPAVGNVFLGANTQRYGVPVRVPIFGAGRQLKYVLTAVIDLDAFGELIRGQELPPTWVSGLIDATGHFIARVPIYLRRLPNSAARSYTLATGKAQTVVTSKMSTEAYRLGVAAGTVTAIPDAVTFSGGIPVLVNGEFAGAIGVSGSTQENDVVVALAGLAAMGN